MVSSNLMDFVEAIKSNPALKEKVKNAEQEAMANIRHQADAIAAIAHDAGFDLSEWAKRPTDRKNIPQQEAGDCPLTCCIAATSTGS